MAKKKQQKVVSNMNKTQSRNEEILREIISRIIKNTTNFQKVVKANWKNVDNKTLDKVTKEYLTFVMYCAVYMLQNNESSDSELEEFHKTFYDAVIKKKLLKQDELLDYERLSRKRYMDFYQILFSINEEQLTGKKLNALVAKEAIYMRKLLSEFKESRNAIGEFYTDLFSVYSGLMLQIQLMFNLKAQVNKQK